MPVELTCDCGQLFTVAEDVVGKPARCPACRSVMIAPRPGTLAKPFVLTTDPGSSMEAVLGEAVNRAPEIAPGESISDPHGTLVPRAGTLAKPFTPAPLFLGPPSPPVQTPPLPSVPGAMMPLMPREGTLAKPFVPAPLNGGRPGYDPAMPAVAGASAVPPPAPSMPSALPGDTYSPVIPREGTLAKPFMLAPLTGPHPTPGAPAAVSESGTTPDGNARKRQWAILGVAAAMLLLICGTLAVLNTKKPTQPADDDDDTVAVVTPKGDGDGKEPPKEPPADPDEGDAPDDSRRHPARLADQQSASFMEMRVALVQVQRAIDSKNLDAAEEALKEVKKFNPKSTEVRKVQDELKSARQEQDSADELERLRADSEQQRERHQIVAKELERLRALKKEREAKSKQLDQELNKLRKELPDDLKERARILAEGRNGLSSFIKLVERGKANLNENKYEAAVKELELALTLNPKNEAATILLDKAKKGLAKVRQEAQEQLKVAEQALTRGELDKANDALMRAARLTPNDPEVAKRLYRLRERQAIQPLVDQLLTEGEKAMKNGRPGDAANAYARLRRLVPDNPEFIGLLRDAQRAERRHAVGRLIKDGEKPGKLDFNLSLKEINEREARTRQEQDLALREQSERFQEAARMRSKALREETDRFLATARQQNLDLRAETDKMLAAERLKNKELAAQTERFALEARRQNQGLIEEGARMAGAARIQNENLRIQGDRMAAAGRAQLLGLREQGDRIARQGRNQMLGLREQGQRMAGAARLQNENLRAQGERMAGAQRQLNLQLREEGERIAGAGRQFNQNLREQNDRFAAAARLEAVGLREQNARMAGVGRQLNENLRLENDRMLGQQRLDRKALAEEQDRLLAAERGRNRDLRDDNDRRAADERLKNLNLREENDRMAGMNRLQNERLRSEGDSMARAARAANDALKDRREPDAGIKKQLEQPKQARKPKPEPNADKARKAVEEFDAKKERKKKESKELKDLRAEQEQRDKDYAEYKQLLGEQKKLDEKAIELKQLQIQKAREIEPIKPIDSDKK
jgi:hypothetical protein